MKKIIVGHTLYPFTSETMQDVGRTPEVSDL